MDVRRVLFVAMVGLVLSATPALAGGQGCTANYWADHPAAWKSTGIDPNNSVNSVFGATKDLGDLADVALIDALSVESQGTGAGVSSDSGATTEEIKAALVAAGIAGVLNALHPDLDYPKADKEVVMTVDQALESGDHNTMADMTRELMTDNRLGCPLER